VSRSTILLVPLLALAPASAGAGAPASRDPVALTAVPAHVALDGSDSATVRLRNSGTRRVAVDVAPAGFALDLHGRPHVVGRRGARSAVGWLTLRPTHFTLGPRTVGSLVLSAHVPAHAEPGDHDALVLLTTRPSSSARVAVRLRLGVVVVVRAPGPVVRRLELRRLRVVRRRGIPALELAVVNDGNVTEQLRHVRAVLSRVRVGRAVVTAAASPRELRPATRGVLEFHLRTRARGRFAARIVLPGEPGRATIRRTFRVRL
jgi:hypothetical protein